MQQGKICSSLFSRSIDNNLANHVGRHLLRGLLVGGHFSRVGISPRCSCENKLYRWSLMNCYYLQKTLIQKSQRLLWKESLKHKITLEHKVYRWISRTRRNIPGRNCEMIRLQRNKMNKQRIIRNSDMIQSKRERRRRLKKYEVDKRESKAEESCKEGIDGFNNYKTAKRYGSR